MKTYSAGIVTAYGSAKAGGYTGTYAEFCAALGDLANVLEDFEGFSVEVSTLAEGESATASYSDGVLSLGIPKGDTGEKPMAEINALSARMDTFTHLAEGSTTGDAELTDIRVAADGTTYPTAGDAVRGQITDLKEDINNRFAILGDYNKGIIKKHISKQYFGRIKKAIVKTDVDETYPDDEPNINRAILPIPSNIIDGKVYVYSLNNTLWSIYYRDAVTNEYKDRLFDYANKSYYELNPEEGYNYFIIYAASDGSFTADDINRLNDTTLVFTGNILNDNDIIHDVVSTNLITPDNTHIGKYYYGAQSPADNAKMAYTDEIPVVEFRTYYFPYITIGYSWYDEKHTVIGGEYNAVEGKLDVEKYRKLVAPTGAKYICLSFRTGDIPNAVFSEIPVSKAVTNNASVKPVLKSSIVRDALNMLYDITFDKNSSPSRPLLAGSGTWTYNGEFVTGIEGCALVDHDTLTMNNSKIVFIVEIPSGAKPNFVVGSNASYTNLSIADGGICVDFLADGNTANIRMGSGQHGTYETLLKTMDISSLAMQSGGRFAIMIEKDSVNRYVVTIYNALTPDVVISETIEGVQDPSDPSAYSGQIRGWGGPYLQVRSDSLNLYRMQMYSTITAYPQIAIWGDSYIENAGRNPRCGYGYLLQEALDKKVFLSGRGGATAKQAYNRFLVESNLCAPKYIVLNFGVNDSFNVNASEYQEYISKMINVCKEKGAEPILITTPVVPSANANVPVFCNTINPWVRSSGYRYIDIAYALSTGDGVTPNTNKFMADGTHPNLAGGQAIFNYIKTFLPDLLLM